MLCENVRYGVDAEKKVSAKQEQKECQNGDSAISGRGTPDVKRTTQNGTVLHFYNAAPYIGVTRLRWRSE
ncbi:hypothetical protein KAM546c_23130 [Enterobacter roggenkampii]|nr:hypothetical protein KAM546c_23130 [Enterobacter roggenkampii]